MKIKRLVISTAIALSLGALMLAACKPETAGAWALLIVAWASASALIAILAWKAEQYWTARLGARRDIILILLFMAVITTPMIVRERFDEAKENRIETQFPAVLNTSFPSGFDVWLNDHFGFRSQMLAAYSRINSIFFSRPIMPNVMMGENEWLFYAPKDDGDPVADFQGTNLFSNEELRIIAMKQDDLYQTLQQQGVAYLLFIPPNKGTIYPEFYPNGIVKTSDSSRMDQVIDYITAHTDVPVVDARQALFAAKAENTLYLATDTHWNSYGAFIAYQTLMHAISELPSMASFQSGLKPRTQEDYYIEEYHAKKGDLLDIGNLAPSQYQGNSVGYTFLSKTPVRYTLEQIDNKHLTTTIDDPALPRVLVYRDSYFSALYPFFANHFNRAEIFWQNPVTDLIKDDISAMDVDIVVVEIVQRYLSKLLVQ